jgi:hypothetical protein
MQRLSLHRTKGPKPKWKLNKKTKAVTKEKSKGGINWYRYETVIIKGKLLPFVLECKKERLGTLIQEDKAPCSTSIYNYNIYSTADIQRLL